jgi:MerR family mercuric resistance operon transcriptional regulator
MQSLTISGFALAGGVGVETIRFYQRRGLLPEPALSRSSITRGIRRYGDADVKRLRFIKSAQASGFTLDQIRELLSLDARKNRKRAREMARARIRDLDTKIAAMTKARRALEDLARLCESGRGCCPIIPVFD